MTQEKEQQNDIVWIADPEEVFVKAELIKSTTVTSSGGGGDSQKTSDSHENDDSKTQTTDNKTKNKLQYTVIKCSDVGNGGNTNGKHVLVSAYYNVNPSTFDKVSNLSELTYLNEPSVLYNLKERYANDMIYTYSGLFLVAINPYQNIKIYGKDYIDLYNNSAKYDYDGGDEIKTPHIFAIAEEAYQNLLNMKKNQSILVTGESGAGKTENTKKILQYLASVTTHDTLLDSNNTNNNNTETLENSTIFETFEQKILKSNPILESFGNAQTVKNNNSSRFGKFIKIEFDEFGKINGAHIDWYLLEKSRITIQNTNERNYHIFYQLLSGLKNNSLSKTELDSKTKNTLNKDSSGDINNNNNNKTTGFNLNNLEIPNNQYSPTHWKILKNSNYNIPGIDDNLSFKELLNSFKTVGFTIEEQSDIFEIISIILHLGNIEYSNHAQKKTSNTTNNDVQASIVSDLKPLSRLLGVDEKELETAILKPKSKVGKEIVYSRKNTQQSQNIVNSLSKIIYEKLFDHIVFKINQSLDHGSMTENYIGLLDIAGFEIFENNSFEQLLINFTNENLQQFFNHHMFILEQNEYMKENILWDYIDYGKDLQSTIDLISSPPSLLSLLDEESIIPNSNDEKFFDRLTHSIPKSDRFKNSKKINHFVLKHYAGDVEYNIDDWLIKNKEPLNDNLTEILSNSSKPLIQKFFNYTNPRENSNKNNTSITTKFKTQSQRHKHQLNELLENLKDTNPLFVRCILPNTKKKAGEFDKQLVLDQLRCNGVLEGIRISREGYPNRIFFKEFYQRYRILVDELQPHHRHFSKSHNYEKIEFVKGNSKKNCELILSSLHLDPYLFKVGNTKLFFKAGVLANIEQLKQKKLASVITHLNSIIRGTLVRQENKLKLDKMNAAAILSTTFQHYNELSKNHWYKLYVNIKPMLTGSSDHNEINTKKNREYISQIKKLKEQLDQNVVLQKKLNDLNDTLNNELRENKKFNEDQSEKIHNYTRLLETAEKTRTEETKQFKEKLEDLNSQHQLVMKDLDDSKKKIDTHDSTMSESLKTIEILTTEKSKLESLISKKESELKKMVQEQTLNNENKQKLTEQIKKFQQKELENNKTILSLKKQLNEQDEDIDVKLQQLEKNFTGTNRKLQKLIEENKNLRESISKYKTENLEIASKLKTSQNALEKLNEKAQNFQNELSQVTKTKDDLFEKLNATTDDLKTLRKEHTELQKNYDTLQDTYTQYQKTVEKNTPITLNTSVVESDPMLTEQIHILKSKLRKEQLFTDYLHQKTVGLEDYNSSENKTEMSAEHIGTLAAQLKDCKHILAKTIKDKDESMSRLKFLRNRLATASLDNQVMHNQIKKLKDLVKSSGKNVDLNEVLHSIGTVDEGNGQLALEVDKLKNLLHEEKMARADAEYFSNILAEKFSKTNGLQNSFESTVHEQFSASVPAQFPNSRNYPYSGDGEERIVQYKKQLVKLQETINQYNSQALKLNDELQNSKNKERMILTELKAVQEDLHATEQQNVLYLSNIQDYKHLSNSVTTNLLDCQNELRDANFELKKSNTNIEKLQSVVKSLQNQSKINEKLLWDKENEIADLEDELSSKDIDLQKLKHVNELLKSDVLHLQNSIQDFKKDQHYIDQIDSLNNKLSEYSRNEIELTKEISSLQYNLDQLEQESETKINELLKQNEHYLTLATALNEEKASLEKTKSELETQLSLMDKENIKLNGMIDKLTQENVHLNKERDELMDELDSKEQEIEKELNSSTSIKNEYHQLKKTLALQDEQIKRNEAFVSKLNESNVGLKESMDSLKKNYMDLEEENKALNTENKDITKKLNSLQARLNDTTERNLWLNKINELERQVNQENSLKFEELKKNKFLERELNDLTEKLDSQSELLIMANKDREDFEKEANKFSNIVSHMENQLAAQNNQSKHLERENKTYQSRIAQLEQELILWKQKYSVRN